jgi:hypothetical protein
MLALLETLFWLDPGDPHRMAAAMQFLARSRDYSARWAVDSGDWRQRLVEQGPVGLRRSTASSSTTSRPSGPSTRRSRVKQSLSE